MIFVDPPKRCHLLKGIGVFFWLRKLWDNFWASRKYGGHRGVAGNWCNSYQSWPKIEKHFWKIPSTWTATVFDIWPSGESASHHFTNFQNLWRPVPSTKLGRGGAKHSPGRCLVGSWVLGLPGQNFKQSWKDRAQKLILSGSKALKSKKMHGNGLRTNSWCHKFKNWKFSKFSKKYFFWPLENC